MSNYNERNSKPAEKLTVAGIAAVIVVGVFVVCVILILAKSLFPSNEDSTPEGVYTGTLSSQAQTKDTKKAPDDASSEESSKADIIDESSAISESSTDSQLDSSAQTSSVAEGEVAYLTQTAYLRAANDENSEPILSMASGDQVTVLERPAGSEYVHVNYNGYDGWVWNGYLG